MANTGLRSTSIVKTEREGPLLISPSPSSLCGEPAKSCVADQLFSNEISRSPESRCGGSALEEACERFLIARLPFLPAPAASSLSSPSVLHAVRAQEAKLI